MRALIVCCLAWFCCINAKAQHDTAVARPQYHYPPDTSYRVQANILDSVAAAMAVREKFVSDSLALQYIAYPDPNRRNQLADSIMHDSSLFYTGYGFLDANNKIKSLVKEGSSRPGREQWIIGVIILLLLYAGIINRLMGRDTGIVLRSFYSRRPAQAAKEESLLNPRAFFALFILFGLTSGLFIYQVSAVYEHYYSITGFQLFLSLSIGIVALFALKLLVLRVIGFIFNVSRIVGQYIAILYLTYFNIAFIFLPLTLCFCLVPAVYTPFILAAAFLLIIVIFVWQYLRSSVGIITGFKFPKFYLIIYLCALEICPVLILIKALNI